MTEKTLLAIEAAAKEPCRVEYKGRGMGHAIPTSGASPAYKAIILELIAEIRMLRKDKNGVNVTPKVNP